MSSQTNKQNDTRKAEKKCEEDDSVKTVSFTVLISSAFALVAALAWNTAIQRLITQYFGDQEQKGAWASLLYAFVLTIFIMLVLYVIQHMAKTISKARCVQKQLANREMGA